PEPAKEVARAHTGRGGEPGGGAGAEDGPALSRGDDHHHAAAAACRQPRAARLPAHPGRRAGTGDPLRVPVRAVLPQTRSRRRARGRAARPGHPLGRHPGRDRSPGDAAPDPGDQPADLCGVRPARAATHLLTAVGPTPHSHRPNFPIRCQWYPPEVQVALVPFGEEALRHFLYLERPDHVDVADAELFSVVCECRPLTATPATLMA